MSTPYTGGLRSWGDVAALQQAAEAATAQEAGNDLSDTHDPDAVRLEGETGQTGGFGSRPGDRVPQLDVTRVSAPSSTRGLPSNLQTNPLGSGRSRGR